MKKRYKILVFVLLLCTMFSTLLFVRPKVNAQVLDDITNTTWIFNNVLQPYEFLPNQISISFDLMDGDYVDVSFSGIEFSYNVMYFVSGGFGPGSSIFEAYNFNTQSWGNYSNVYEYRFNENGDANFRGWLGNNATLVSSPPSGGDTENIAGGYRFNSSISTSIFGDIEEQELDILFENNFFLYNNTEVAYDMFSLHADELGNNYFCYENSTSGNYIRVGVVSLDNTYISMFSQYRTIEWVNQEVSDDTYIWLNENGEFGEFDTPSEPAPDDMFGWLLDSVNAFLQIEILPGVRIIWLIQFALVVPIALIILKLYFGG